eukprot:288174-Pelagomonas_calceolata.AAC.1
MELIASWRSSPIVNFLEGYGSGYTGSKGERPQSRRLTASVNTHEIMKEKRKSAVILDYKKD